MSILAATAFIALGNTLSGDISGSLTIRERIAIPNQSVIVVSLVRDFAGRKSTLSSLTFTTGGKQPPFRYNLPFHIAPTREASSYSIIATLAIDGQVRFSKDSSISLDSAGAKKLDLVLVNQPPAMMSFLDKEWILFELNGKPIGSPERPPTVLFSSENNRVAGMGGVNRFGGEFQLNGQEIKIENTVSTKMAGPPELMELEMGFFQALRQVTLISASQTELTFMRGTTVLARFRLAAE
ncbi:MAG: META domain-containing protein [Fimbriimonadaceae bacterium]|jgi:putative lipoprotein|nr:META domain-containing protein [Fimbriimonadaceae bacterium]